MLPTLVKRLSRDKCLQNLNRSDQCLTDQASEHKVTKTDSLSLSLSLSLLGPTSQLDTTSLISSPTLRFPGHSVHPWGGRKKRQLGCENSLPNPPPLLGTRSY